MFATLLAFILLPCTIRYEPSSSSCSLPGLSKLIFCAAPGPDPLLARVERLPGVGSGRQQARACVSGGPAARRGRRGGGADGVAGGRSGPASAAPFGPRQPGHAHCDCCRQKQELWPVSQHLRATQILVLLDLAHRSAGSRSLDGLTTTNQDCWRRNTSYCREDLSPTVATRSHPLLPCRQVRSQLSRSTPDLLPQHGGSGRAPSSHRRMREFLARVAGHRARRRDLEFVRGCG